jgi:dolichol-phosphate mannosyltransferase
MIYYIVPVFNASEVIGQTITNLIGVSVRQKEPFLIIAIDDGSTDGSADVIAAHPAAKNIRLIRFQEHRGLGKVIQAGFTAACAQAGENDPIVFINPDGSNDPQAIPAMLEKFKAGADVISASRYAEGGSAVGFTRPQELVRKLANFLLRAGFPLPHTTDYTCYLKMYRSGVVKQALGFLKNEIVISRGFSANAEFFIKMCLFTDRFVQVPSICTHIEKGPENKFDTKNEAMEFIYMFILVRHAIKDYVTAG